jgi:succinate dehydrogenase flavin-adding protein (antitoxin of CptAB toxin-antitoxin module)
MHEDLNLVLKFRNVEACDVEERERSSFIALLQEADLQIFDVVPYLAHKSRSHQQPATSTSSTRRPFIYSFSVNDNPDDALGSPSLFR